MSKHDDYQLMQFKTAAMFEKWLATNSSKEDGVWIKMAKAKSGIESVTHEQAIESALCYGWIDGLRRALDEHFFIQKFTPRRPRSIWSVINKKKVAALIKDGRMKAGGLAAIEDAKKNGQWDSAYESFTTITEPEDLQKALNQNSKAKAFYAKLSKQNRYAILFRIGRVKKAETRAKKIEDYIKMLAKEETIYPQ